jgi:diadenosine tetraphosphate (Ap4A) HIT family hydrolase
MFDLHPRLRQDCVAIGRFRLSRLLLMNESRYPWFILVPERESVGEIYQLAEDDQVQLIRESSYLARILAELFRADRVNVAAIGNLVPQLHLHHVVRYRGDPAWPAPVWGRFDPVPYTDIGIGDIRQKLRQVSLRDFEYLD